MDFGYASTTQTTSLWAVLFGFLFVIFLALFLITKFTGLLRPLSTGEPCVVDASGISGCGEGLICSTAGICEIPASTASAANAATCASFCPTGATGAADPTTCASFFPSNRHTYTSMPNITFPGNDLMQIPSTDLTFLKQTCNLLPNCAGFTQSGLLKSVVSGAGVADTTAGTVFYKKN